MKLSLSLVMTDVTPAQASGAGPLVTPPDAGALKHCIALFQGPTLHPRIRNQMLGFLSFFSTTMSHTCTSDF